jgi:hypothetical protein
MTKKPHNPKGSGANVLDPLQTKNALLFDDEAAREMLRAKDP